jgi:eukaryotic-like serine/threonine-protein kinase
MPSESSNPECFPSTETPHTPVPGDVTSLLSFGSTQPPEFELTALGSIQSGPGSEGPPATRSAGEVETAGGVSLTEANSSPPSPLGRLPRFLGEYELLSEIARGGMGVVYRARQEKLKRMVAVKLIRSGSLAGVDDLRRFRQEAEAMADLDHPHIIPIYELRQEDDQPYFSMKLVEGGNLTRHIPRLKSDPDAVAALIAKVARAVHFAHQRTILHRDIKPSNILLAEHDEPYVTDFGLAKRIRPDSDTIATMTGVVGTPAYMPPEQARGGAKSVTTAADIYSLGATLYETLTGHPPFSGDSVGEIMRQVLEQEPARPRSINPKLDRDLETICMKCLDKEPARRYGSAEALAEDLERWRAGLPIMARPVPTWEKAVKWVKRRRLLASLVLVLHLALLGLIGGGIWFTLQLWKERDMANRGRYAADMNLARRALDDGLIYQVREQLKDYRTGPRALGKLRSFEWYYLANLCDQTPIRLRGHEKAVICVAFHPDGNRVVSGGSDGTVRIWDLSSRQALHVFTGKGGSVHCVAVSPDGHWLAAGDAGGGLRLWDMETRRERALVAHHRRLASVAFSPLDSQHLLSTEVSGLIVQWNVRTGEREFPLQHGRHEEGGTPVVVNNATELFRGAIAAYCPDGKSIVSVGLDQWVMIWDVATRQMRDQILIGSNIMGLSISHDSREVALAKESNGIEVLDMGKPHGPRRAVPSMSREGGAVAYNPVGRTLATLGFGGGAELLDAQSGRLLDVFDDRVNLSPYSLAFGAAGGLLAMATRDEIHVVPLGRGREGVTVAASPGPIHRFAASPDERLLALGRDDGTIDVWDVRAARVLQPLSGHDLAVFGLAFVSGPSGERLVSVGGDGLIKIWDPEAGGQPLFTLVSRAGAVYAVAVRPDGRQIATGGEDGKVRTWDPTTGHADLAPLDHGAPISALAYDSTSTALASGGMDKTVRVWSVTSGHRRLGPMSHQYQITSLAFSPDGQFLAGGGGATDKGGRILVWDAPSGTISARVECPRGVNSLSFSRDSRRIATCGSDSVVQVWDAIGGHETLSLAGHGGRVSAVYFAPRDLRLYSAGSDGVVKLWDGSVPAPAE